MKPHSIITLVAAALFGVGAAYWSMSANESDRPRQNAASPPQPTSIYTPPPGRAQPGEDTARQARDHNQSLALEIERALVSANAQEREAAFNFLLPELIVADPARVVAMVARQEPGEARDTLRTEVVRQWISADAPAAIGWMKSLDAEERRASAATAVAVIAAHDMSKAIGLADEFDVGTQDGSLEYLAQRWATEDLHAATEWIETQPPGPRTDKLRARIDFVREQANASIN